MALAPGTRLGPYEIQSALGAGGMGEVYKARDTRLDRTVAIKILPATLAADPQFRARFDREAHTISQLDHPHICALYDVGEQDGTSFLVMPYLEGHTLADRLATGPLPVHDALAIATQIADALDKAHRAGIVHRDLKPGNIFLTKSGAKLLDFGLAKSSGPAIVGAGATRLPTTPPSLTAQGTLLGTFQYMAPEQIEGGDADARSDLFAFGCVLYEMLTGQKAFEGKTQASLMAAILEREPRPIVELRPLTPAVLEHAVRRCFAKDPDERWQTVRDLWEELRWIDTEVVPSATATGAATDGRTTRERLAWSVAAAAVVVAAAMTGLWISGRRDQIPRSPVRLEMPAPEGVSLLTGQTPAISPDGTRLVFVATDRIGKTLLWVRPLGSLTATPLPGTDDAVEPSWAPDSRFLAFFAQGKLKRIDASGGSAQTICDVQNGRGIAWTRESLILFGRSSGEIYKVDSRGGQPVQVTTLDAKKHELSHRYPQVLPDGRHFLFYLQASTPETRGVYVGSLDSPEKRRVLATAASGLYANGYLFFQHEGVLHGQAFDITRMEVRGDPIPLADHVAVDTNGRSVVSVSDTGMLAYGTSALARTNQFLWLDRAGKPLGAVGEPALSRDPILSHDGHKLAFARINPDTGTYDIWATDIERGVTSPVTFDPATDVMPLWSPDGQRLLFGSNRAGGQAAIYEKSSSSSTAEHEVFRAEDRNVNSNPLDWSADGSVLIYRHSGLRGGLWGVRLMGNGKTFPLVDGNFTAREGRVSPDGRWLAYDSNESREFDIYVQPFPPSGAKWRISTTGGRWPMWRGDGQELFYMTPDGTIVAVAIGVGPTLELGPSMPLFRSHADVSDGNVARTFVPSPDGQRFLVTSLVGDERPAIGIIENWPAALRKE